MDLYERELFSKFFWRDFIMEKENELMTMETQEEKYVTNVAIKTTDVLCAIGAGVFALAGIGTLLNVRKKKAILEKKETFKENIIKGLIVDGASEEEIKNAKELLDKYA